MTQPRKAVSPQGLSAVVLELCLSGSPTIVRAAARLGMSPRTLQRQFAAQGETYSQLVARIRHEAALLLLQEKDLSIAAIATTLGYSDPSHFSRAFTRWSGMSPRSMRRKQARRMTYPQPEGPAVASSKTRHPVG